MQPDDTSYTGEQILDAVQAGVVAPLTSQIVVLTLQVRELQEERSRLLQELADRAAGA